MAFDEMRDRGSITKGLPVGGIDTEDKETVVFAANEMLSPLERTLHRDISVMSFSLNFAHYHVDRPSASIGKISRGLVDQCAIWVWGYAQDAASVHDSMYRYFRGCVVWGATGTRDRCIHGLAGAPRDATVGIRERHYFPLDVNAHVVWGVRHGCFPLSSTRYATYILKDCNYNWACSDTAAYPADLETAYTPTPVMCLGEPRLFDN